MRRWRVGLTSRVHYTDLVVAAVALLAVWGTSAVGQPPAAAKQLRIGTSGTLTAGNDSAQEGAALDTLRSFIKDETGFESVVTRQKDWRELADKMTRGDLDLGVFQGHEFAWAQPQSSKLRPLAVAVNVRPYRQAILLVRQDSKAKDVAELQGQSLALPEVGMGHLDLYIRQLAESHSKDLQAFFGKITRPTNFEDAVDDVVDGVVQATVVDRVGLEAYKRRKPGRFARVKALAQSAEFPSPIVAYTEGGLDQVTSERFRIGLVGASRKEKGQRLLTLFRLTGFEAPPGNLDQVLAETRTKYPPSKE